MKNQNTNTMITNNYTCEVYPTSNGVMYIFENGYGLFLTNDGFMSIYDKDENQLVHAIYHDEFIDADLNEHGIYKNNLKKNA